MRLIFYHLLASNYFQFNAGAAEFKHAKEQNTIHWVYYYHVLDTGGVQGVCRGHIQRQGRFSGVITVYLDVKVVLDEGRKSEIRNWRNVSSRILVEVHEQNLGLIARKIFRACKCGRRRKVLPKWQSSFYRSQLSTLALGTAGYGVCFITLCTYGKSEIFFVNIIPSCLQFHNCLIISYRGPVHSRSLFYPTSTHVCVDCKIFLLLCSSAQTFTG